jgi:2-oxoisovalerate dehydrogenase E1 component beta subunit
MIVHEDTKAGGIGAEVAAIISESAFDYLDGPVMRLAGPEVPPMPFSPPLEDIFMVNPDQIVEAIEALAGY